MNEFNQWLDHHFGKIQEDLFTFLKFRTISADPQLVNEHERCAQWLVSYFRSMDFHSEVIPTSGLPIVYAENLQKGPSAPTLLIYGHYDVQPVDPIELWKTDPFLPIEKNGEIYARGAQDDKGQIFFVISALKYFHQKHLPLPINVKFCIEGEEENGSQGLSKALSQMKHKLKADALLVVDFDILDAQTPAINLGARGLIPFDIVLRGSNADLHSGGFGGIAYNPNRAAAELMAQLWDANGRVAVDHFYDDVLEMSMDEKKVLSRGNAKVIQEAGIEALGGEKGWNPIEACWLRPTIEINGISGGYAGPGFKTVIPAETHIKLSCRLVPNQNPQRIGQIVKEYLIKKVKKGIHINVDVLHGGGAYRGSAESKLALAVSKAYEDVFQQPCQKILAGGSIPVVAELIHALHLQVVGMGCGLASDQIHAPNEHFGIDRFKKGMLTVIRTIEYFGE